MIRVIRGLHHVTALAADARANNQFFTGVLGLRRVKKTVNFDAPQVYHLYYGDETGAPGTVMTHFPFPGMARGRRGAGEAVLTEFAIPAGALPWWTAHLAAAGVTGLREDDVLGDRRLDFDGPDGDSLALVEVAGDVRAPWTADGVPGEVAIRGFRGVRLRLREAEGMTRLLALMGYAEAGRDGALVRHALAAGNGAQVVDLEIDATARDAVQGAGSVHHVAFSVPDRAAQDEVRAALTASGLRVTEPIDRDYFHAIYFRAPGGVLFEVATDEPGFERDEDRAHLGEALRLPAQHEHLRPWLETHLPPIEG
ncbi:VOC family protein [Limibaculum sp. FT325]|uniref:VOC family protein n=1 Tax=Thermohalobaculum sediminis TaxID=2939436 RepID=UPI0020BF7AF2|nr:VOC family protein [Limibaculum sediminis]MCL5779184.1 VOC family protein [Limibaculum sediminis]